MRRQRAVAARGNRAASYPYVVTIPMPSEPLRIAEIDRQAQSIAAGRCGRWTSKAPDRLHVGFHEAAHRDAFVLWLAMSGIETG